MDDDPLIRLEDDPMTDEVHHPYTAFNQGFDAGLQGIPISLNPYQDGEWKSDWDSGHEEATEQNL